MNAKNIITVVVVAVLLFACGFWAGLHYHGATDNKIRAELNNAQNQQREITDTVAELGKTSERTDNLITECLSILRRVRTQPTAETTQK